MPLFSFPSLSTPGMSPDIASHHTRNNGSSHADYKGVENSPSSYGLPYNGSECSLISTIPPTASYTSSILSAQDDIDSRKKQKIHPLSLHCSPEKNFREKAKRHRVTPEQLSHLERQFAADHSPNAIKRREISELLGMQERQTQVWFQNRRAKAKAQCRREQGSIAKLNYPDAQTQHTTSPRVDVTSEGEAAASIIHCKELRIGSWRRLANSSQGGLTVMVTQSRRCLVWLVHIQSYSYKMEISFDIIVEAKLTPLTLELGHVSFLLSRPPLFYLDDHATPAPFHWKPCQDWTHGQQASRTLLHELFGPSTSLVDLLVRIPTHVTTGHQPYPPHYSLEQLASPLNSMEQSQKDCSEQTGPGHRPPSVDQDLSGKRPSFPGLITAAPSPGSASSNDSSGCPTPYSAATDIHPFKLLSQTCHDANTSCPTYTEIDASHNNWGFNQDRDFYTQYRKSDPEDAHIEFAVSFGQAFWDQKIPPDYRDQNNIHSLASHESSHGSYCFAPTKFDDSYQSNNLLSPLQAPPYPYPFPGVSPENAPLY